MSHEAVPPPLPPASLSSVRRSAPLSGTLEDALDCRDTIGPQVLASVCACTYIRQSDVRFPAMTDFLQQ